MDNSPLNKLSSELLNKIAEMVLYQKEGITVNGKNNQPNATAFSKTCKKMYEDYALLYYNINAFTIITTSTNIRIVLAAFETLIGPTYAEILGPIIMIVELSEGYSANAMEGAGLSMAFAVGELSERNHPSRCVSNRSIAELRLRLWSGLEDTVREFSISQENPRKSLEAAAAQVNSEFLQALHAQGPLPGLPLMPLAQQTLPRETRRLAILDRAFQYAVEML